MHFDNPETERAFLLDVADFYLAKSIELMNQPSFTKSQIEEYQAISALADSAKEVAELLKTGN